MQVLRAALEKKNLDRLFEQQVQEEEVSKRAVLHAQKYEGTKLTESSMEDVIKKAMEKKRKADRDAR